MSYLSIRWSGKLSATSGFSVRCRGIHLILHATLPTVLLRHALTLYYKYLAAQRNLLSCFSSCLQPLRRPRPRSLSSIQQDIMKFTIAILLASVAMAVPVPIPAESMCSLLLKTSTASKLTCLGIYTILPDPTEGESVDKRAECMPPLSLDKSR